MKLEGYINTKYIEFHYHLTTWALPLCLSVEYSRYLFINVLCFTFIIKFRIKGLDKNQTE